LGRNRRRPLLGALIGATRTHRPQPSVVVAASTTVGVVSAFACGDSMCESKAYLATAEGEQLVLEDVASIREENEGYRLTNLFGEQIHLRCRIRDIDLMKHRIVFEPVREGTPNGT